LIRRSGYAGQVEYVFFALAGADEALQAISQHWQDL
jgi:hypothetical protein